MSQKLNSSISVLDTIIHTTIISSSKTQLISSSLLYILGVYFSLDLPWKVHITSLSKRASTRLGALQNFFTPSQLLTLYRGVVHSYTEYVLHIWGCFPHTALLEKVESRTFLL